MNTDVIFSSLSDEWSTPQYLFDSLNDEFHFTLDPCANEFNHKCEFYFTKFDDGLKKDWSGYVFFCNPPYGRSIGLWVKKAYEEFVNNHVVSVLLIPARTDTKYFHDYIYGKAEIRFLRGRLKFNDYKTAAPFPSMIVVFS